MAKIIYRLAIICLSLLVSTAAFATVSISDMWGAKPKTGVVIITLTNEITTKDASKVINVIKQAKKIIPNGMGLVVKLDSTGGDVTAALRIGRILRINKAIALISEGSVCMSSCVYVLAGAAFRNVGGKVGIHRPYEPDGKSFLEATQKAKYTKLGTEIRAYLESMNISTKLYDDSLFISPENIKVLSKDEMISYGLNANDPYFDEAASTEQASKLGISRAEYAARVLRSRQVCHFDDNAVDQYFDCQQAIINGNH